MNPSDNKALTRRWFDEVWNKRRSEAIDELMAADGIAHGLGGSGAAALPGREQFRTFWKTFCGAFPDIQITVEQIIGEGDLTAARFSFRGTHRGDHLGVPATGKPINVTGMTLVRWRNGQIVEGWNEFDALSVFQNTGVVQPARRA